MTAYTLKILAAPAAADADEAPHLSRNLEVVQDLARWARECGAYPLRSWADKHHAPLYYIDNSSVRAKVTGSQVRQFAAEVLKDADIDVAVDEGATYLIAASEF